MLVETGNGEAGVEEGGEDFADGVGVLIGACVLNLAVALVGAGIVEVESLAVGEVTVFQCWGVSVLVHGEKHRVGVSDEEHPAGLEEFGDLLSPSSEVLKPGDDAHTRVYHINLLAD